MKVSEAIEVLRRMNHSDEVQLVFDELPHGHFMSGYELRDYGDGRGPLPYPKPGAYYPRGQ